MTRTPEEEAIIRARFILAHRGYASGDVIDYEDALAMLKEAILENRK